MLMGVGEARGVEFNIGFWITADHLILSLVEKYRDQVSFLRCHEGLPSSEPALNSGAHLIDVVALLAPTNTGSSSGSERDQDVL